MKRERARQLLTVFSLFMLLVLPTAIVGYGNFAKIINQAFAKPFQKQESTFIVQTESSANISKGSEFSLKFTVSAPKSLPLKHFAAFVEYDATKVDIKSVRTQNNQSLTVIKFQNGFLVYPSSMTAPADFQSLLPATCSRESTCDFAKYESASVVLSLNGILLSELTEQQRPIKVSIVGASETSSVAFWNEKLVLPVLKLGSYVKNSTPQFLSEPSKYISESEPFTYTVTASDSDNDPLLLSLVCPDTSYCTTVQKAPQGLVIEDNQIRWNQPVPSSTPYEVTVYANDGKSVSTQTFALKVLRQDESYFACTFTPAISVRILDYRVSTPLVVVAESSVDLTSSTVTLERGGTTEQTFAYTFSPPKRSVILDQTSKPPLSYQFKQGAYTGRAEFVSTRGEHFTCELENPTVSLSSLIRQAAKNTLRDFVQTVRAATGLAVGTNVSPVFTSDPMVPPGSGGSSPGVSFVYSTPYSFTLKAQDADGDPLQHTVVTKPSWAAVAITSSSSGTAPSTYSIQFAGTPAAKDAGSNLFSVSVNDGYGHYITRTWVINVDYPNNDIPKVTIVEPVIGVTRYQGSPFLLKWEIEDRHQVVSFGVYYTKNLASTTKTTYNGNISYNTRGITVNTSSIPPGDYYFIVTATDGFSPPAIGSGYTAMVRILPPKPKPTATPKPTITATATATPTPTITPTLEPPPLADEVSIQITSPKNQVSIKPSEFQAVVSMTASSKGTLSVTGTLIKLDADDVTSKFTFSAEQGKALTASYRPATLLEPGVHELTVKVTDSVQKDKEVKITFIVVADGEVDPNTVNIFGINMSKSAYTIFIAALILIAILLLLPIILYLAFRNSDKDKGDIRRPVTPIQPSTPPTLRTPNTSIPPTNPQSVQTVGYQPAFTPVPRQDEPSTVRVEPVTSDIPRITPSEALASFIAQTPLQSPGSSTSPSEYAPVAAAPVNPTVFTHVPTATPPKDHAAQVASSNLPKSAKPIAHFQPTTPAQRLIAKPPQIPAQVTRVTSATIAPPTVPSMQSNGSTMQNTTRQESPVFPVTRMAPTLQQKQSKSSPPPSTSPNAMPSYKTPATTSRDLPPQSPSIPKL